MKQFEIVRAAIERDIREDKYPVLATLPRLEELASEQACSVATIRRAMRDLIDAGVVRSAKKRGTVVMRKPAAGRAIIFLSSDAHTNILLQEPICGALSRAHFDVDLLAGGVGVTALRNWCRRLLAEKREPDALVLFTPESKQAEGPETLQLLAELFPRQVRIALDAFEPAASPGIHWVLPDWRQEASCVVEFLQGTGHRRIAVWGGYSDTEGGRYPEVARRIEELWEATGGSCTVYFMNRYPEGLAALIRREGITAFIDLNDNTAMITLSLLHREGLRVPQDVSIIGRHDTPWAEQADPALTSISINPEGVAGAVVESLKELAAGRLRGRVFEVPPTVVVRSSTALPGKG